MTVIHKMQLRLEARGETYIRAGARPLAVQVQREAVCLWAMVDDAAPLVRRSYAIVGTGHSAEHAAGMTYVGTVQLGGFVFHVFLAPDPAAP